MLTRSEGEKAVRFARKIIDNYVRGEDYRHLDILLDEKFKEKSGAFVTILTYPGKNLRGCIGIPEPIYSLERSIEEAAKSATRDPRFPPLRDEELSNVIVEVTILTPPKPLIVNNPKEYLKKIKIGRDGLIVEKGLYRGLLLPQVPVEYGWSVEEFLSETCMKAGLPPDSWVERDTKIYVYQGQIFTETKPHGPIEERKIDRESN